MGTPNILTAAISNKRTALLALTTAPQVIVSNSASSGRVAIVNSLYVCNVGAAAATVDADVFRNGVAFRIAKGVSVPVAGTAALVDTTDVFYLEESDVLRLTASANSTLEAVCSYDTIS